MRPTYEVILNPDLIQLVETDPATPDTRTVIAIDTKPATMGDADQWIAARLMEPVSDWDLKSLASGTLSIDVEPAFGFGA